MDIKTKYPMVLTAKIHITDGETDGEVKYQFPTHSIPNEDFMEGVLDKVKEMLPDGFRFMSRHESTMYFLRQEKGYRGPSLALPSMDNGERWHDPEMQGKHTFRDSDNDYDDEEEF